MPQATLGFLRQTPGWIQGYESGDYGYNTVKREQWFGGHEYIEIGVLVY